MVGRAKDAGSQPVAGPEGAAILERHPDLAEIVRRIVAAYEPERVYLFGSYARGDAGPDSDYDILVVVPGSAGSIFASNSYPSSWQIGLSGTNSGGGPPGGTPHVPAVNMLPTEVSISAKYESVVPGAPTNTKEPVTAYAVRRESMP